MLFSHGNHTVSIHGKTAAEQVDLCFKWQEIVAAKERDEQQKRQLSQNKQDVTAPAATQHQPAPHQHFQGVHKLLHKFGFE